MCIRVRYAPRQSLEEPYDASRLVITLPRELHEQYAMRALRAVLAQLDIEQPEFGARCWCGEQIGLRPLIPQQRRSDEVINLGV
ncbi:hypothetical protein ABZ330_00115 [Streptomyces sp. NPDC006172]|uniref:hypothetical protein n=1 Tax=Streptomyces sp. NPDC006172 TaxID=3154470 RepID=UPI0033FC0E94